MKAFLKILISIIICSLIVMIVANISIFEEYTLAASRGVADFSGLELSGGKVFLLNGSWEFYWHELYEPRDFPDNRQPEAHYFTLPGLWNNYDWDGKKLPEEGFATLRLRIRGLDPEMDLALKMPYVYSAYKLWWNGQLAAANGEVGRTKEDIENRRFSEVIHLTDLKQDNEILIQIANFDFYRGGINLPIYLGERNTIEYLWKTALLRDMFLAGGFLMSGILFLLLYFKCKKEKTALYFGIVCLVFTIRSLIVNEIIIGQLFPNFDWLIGNRIESGINYAGIPFAFLFLSEFYKEQFAAGFKKIWQNILPFLLLWVLLAPHKLYDNFIVWFYIPLVISGIYVCYCILKAVHEKIPGALFILISCWAIFLSAVNDIFVSLGLLGTSYTFHFWLFVFIIFQDYILIGDYIEFHGKVENYALENEKMYQEIRQLNENLERTITERTQELETANKKLKKLSQFDSLTGIPNRRSFDKAMGDKWQEARKEHKPLSMIIIDIDFFKQYNDFYGHIAGDRCLKKISRAISGCLRRSHDFAARYGGEEFVVILPDTDEKGAVIISEKIRKKVEEMAIPHYCSTIADIVTISLGTATILYHKEISITEFFNSADAALYEAKQKGRNKVISSYC
ncbi:MAG: diguanylate cyclase [Peptococcaceae bacterium]